MARGKRPARVYSLAYRKRIEPKIGMTIEEARRRGISLQAARGHHPTMREGVRVGGEKKALEERRRASGALSDTERAFLKRQIRKEAFWRPLDEKQQRARHARDVFERMSPEQRAALMAAQRRLAAGYLARKKAVRRAGRGKRGGAGVIGVNQGAKSSYEYGSGQDDFEDWFEDEFPDLDSDSDLLIFYH